MSRVGNVINGKYEILKEIGHGGMSTVYLAMDMNLNKQWAVKEIRKISNDPMTGVKIQSSITEANLMKSLDHPALPRIVDIINTPEVIYVIMDYIEGEPLSRLLAEEGAQPVDLVVEWGKQICDVLGYLHSRQPAIIYRDMKPSNVMLRPDGGIKVIDFGIAREYKEVQTSDTTCLGTRGYAAPEQFNELRQSDARTDIFCLGVTLFHLLTGQDPKYMDFQDFRIRQYNPTLSGGLENVILKCTNQDPDERYQSAAELMYALENYEDFDNEVILRMRKKWKTFLVTSCCALVCLGIGIFGTVSSNMTISSQYEELLEQAEKATTDEICEEKYLEAIDLKPGDPEAYIELIDFYKQSTEEGSTLTFSTERADALISRVTANLDELSGNDLYATLCFEMGKLYWNYYGYGMSESGDTNSNLLVRMKSSRNWFRDAIDAGGIIIDDEGNEKDILAEAEVYYNIGDFNTNINAKQNDIEDKGMYADYFENLEKIFDLSQNSDSDLVRMEAYNMILYSLNAYARNFAGDGVPAEDVVQLFNRVVEDASEIVGVNHINDLLVTFEKSVGPAKRALQRSYGDEVMAFVTVEFQTEDTEDFDAELTTSENVDEEGEEGK